MAWAITQTVKLRAPCSWPTPEGRVISPMNASCRLLRHSKAHWLLPTCPPASPSWGRKCLYLSCPCKPADSPQMSPQMENQDSRRGGGVSHLSIVSLQPPPSLVILESQASESGGGAVGGGDGWQVLEGRGLGMLRAALGTLMPAAPHCPVWPGGGCTSSCVWTSLWPKMLWLN